MRMCLCWCYSSWSCTHVWCYARTSSSGDVNVLSICAHSESKELEWFSTHFGSIDAMWHTGSIDAMWRLCKMCIPPSLSSRNTVSLMCHLRQWQWRWSNGNNDLAHALGKAISWARRHKWKKGRAKKETLVAFCKNGHKIRHAFSGCFFDSPEIHHVENHHFATVKTHFFLFSIFWFCKKCTTTSAVFNPAGCFSHPKPLLVTPFLLVFLPVPCIAKKIPQA